MKSGLESLHPSRFVSYISFALNYYFHQYDTTGYRVVNLVIHAFNGIILYFLVLTTLATPALRSRYSRAREIALFTALIWLVHPLATQSVAYIVQRMNSLAAMFYALSLLLYARARLANSNKARWTLLAGCALSGLLALGSKENAATLPMFILLYEWYFFRDLDWTWAKRHYRPILALAGLVILVALVYLGSSPLSYILSGYKFRTFTLVERLLTESRVVVSYFSLMVFPHPSRLCLENDFRISHSLVDPITTLLSITTIAGILWAAVRMAMHARLLSFATIWFLGNLVIESSVIPLEIYFEHRTYLPSMFPIFLGVTFIYRFLENARARLGVLCIVIILFSIWAHDRSSVWKDPVRLYQDVVQKNPKVARGHANLGAYLVLRNQFEEAIPHLSEAIRLQPIYLEARRSLGIALIKLGRLDEAIQNFREATYIVEANARDFSRLGHALLKNDKDKEAVIAYQKAIELDPNVAMSHYRLGIALTKLNRNEEAIQAYRQTIRLQPNYVNARDYLGVTLFRQGFIDEALQELKMAVKIAPDHADAQAHLGIILLTRGRAVEAITHLDEALRIKPGHVDAMRYYEDARKKAALAAKDNPN
jgi:Flp pilus assembly protein TadD